MSAAGKRTGLVALAVLATLGLAALGVWQLERLSWKLDLIARVEVRTAASPAPLLPPQAWAAVNEDDDAYRHVQAQGTFLYRCQALVTALTELGSGYWVMTPLETPTGIVLVNRGFVPSDAQDQASRAASQLYGMVTVTGLLRMSEPGGTFLRHNDPKADKWFSRDVKAIAERCGLAGPVAPFFIDEDAGAGPTHYPVGGLTVVRFDNNHLLYAIIWFALSLLSAGGATLVLRSGLRTNLT